jgi:hypothetical protein
MSSIVPSSGSAARQISGSLWVLSFLLFLPVIALYGAHFIPASNGAVGTGFLQYDQPYYMAIARKYFDDGGLSFIYGLPFSPDPGTPRIYFQPLTFALGVVEYVSGADPGLIFVLAEFVLGIVCCRAAIELYREVIGLDRTARRIGLVCFVWGGGFTILAAIVHGVVSGEAIAPHLFDFDDMSQGWWLPNLGRNLVIPTEAFYHAVFLLSIVLVLRRQFGGAVCCVALLSLSHPFSGLQLIAVLGAWAIIELLSRSPDRPPPWFAAALAFIGCLHVGYYLIFLPHASAEHLALQQQWTLAWTFHYWNFAASDGFVGMLALVTLAASWRSGGPDWRQRLFLFWFAVSLTLANHDLFMTPVQPLHFTRGYIWIPLFLLGAPALIRFIDEGIRITTARRVSVACVLFLFLLDNTEWIGTRVAAAIRFGAHTDEITLSRVEREVLSQLGSPELKNYLLISEDEKIGYLATVYAPLRSWSSHIFNTPYSATRRAELSAFFEAGSEPSAWRARPLVAVIAQASGEALHKRLLDVGFHDLFENKRFLLLSRSNGKATVRLDR